MKLLNTMNGILFLIFLTLAMAVAVKAGPVIETSNPGIIEFIWSLITRIWPEEATAVLAFAGAAAHLASLLPAAARNHKYSRWLMWILDKLGGNNLFARNAENPG